MNQRKTSIRNLGRKLSLLLLFMAVCISAGFMRAETAYAKTYKIKTANDWKNIAKKKGGTFKLTKNIKLKRKQYLTISKNKKYVIDLNGHTVTDNGTGSTACPLAVKKGTVTLKSSKKGKGVLYSKEWMAVTVTGNAKFYLKSGAIVNDTTEFRTGLASGIYVGNSASCYVQGGTIRSVNNGVAVADSGKLYVTGTPRICAGYLNTTMNFTHYGSGIYIQSATCKLVLQGGSIGTMSNPDTVTLGAMGSLIIYTGSGHYPVLDRSGKVLAKTPGYKFVDAGGNERPVYPSNLALMYPQMAGLFPGESKLETWTKDAEGYYTIYVIPG